MQLTYRKYIIGVAILFLLLGLGMGWWLAPTQSGEKTAEKKKEKQEVEAWTCSMHPQIRKDEPGKCPICGMDLIPASKAGGSKGMDPDAVSLSETARKLAGLQTQTVRKKMPEKTLRLDGKVRIDKDRMYHEPAHFPGRIEKNYIRYEGQHISAGEPVARIYAPELVSAQKELLEAVRVQGPESRMAKAARQKLKRWKITDKQIKAIEKAGEVKKELTVYARRSGVVMERKVLPGDYVNKGQPLYRGASLATVWVTFEAYAEDFPWIREGDSLQFTVPSLPGETFDAQITFVDPVMNDERRVVQVRTEARNKNGMLKPSMLAQATLTSKGSYDSPQLVVPESAVLWTGPRSVVYTEKETDDGPVYKLREVTLGEDLGDAYVIKDGLESGEKVVSQAAFTVDAAAQLENKPSMMKEERSAGLQGKVSGAFKMQFRNLQNHYLDLKNALVNSDSKAAGKAAEKMVDVLETMRQETKGKSMDKVWIKYYKHLKMHSQAVAESDNIKEQRKQFVMLSEKMISLSEQLGTAKGKLYVQHCPMARDGEGADWLSRDRPVRNPYYGDEMLTCGKVTDSIETNVEP